MQTWNDALNADFRAYVHTQGQSVLRTARYTIPAALEAHVSLIAYTTDLPLSRVEKFIQRNEVDEVGAPLVGGVTPSFLMKYYEIGTDAKVRKGEGEMGWDEVGPVSVCMEERHGWIWNRLARGETDLYGTYLARLSCEWARVWVWVLYAGVVWCEIAMASPTPECYYILTP